MKSSMLIAAIALATTASAYQCPATAQVNQACGSIDVSPLVCSNPKVNVDACNAKQCNQTYIDNYSACQCRRSATGFYESSVNVEGLLKRCGIAGLTNPYGNPDQYRPGQGTQTFSPTPTSSVATRIYDGTTYYGGETGVVSGTTRIVSATAVVKGTMILPGTTTWSANTPGIILGTSTRLPNATAAPVVDPTVVPTVVPVVGSSTHISKGAIAGIVLGTLAAAVLAGLLGLCWRKKRADHTTVYNNYANNDPRGPTRTVVTEKIEPVVVKSVPNTGASAANYNTGVGVGAASSANSAPGVGHNYNSTNVPSSTNYNTTSNVPATNNLNNPYNTTTSSTNAYNTQPRVGGVDHAENAAHNASNTVSNATH